MVNAKKRAADKAAKAAQKAAREGVACPAGGDGTRPLLAAALGGHVAVAEHLAARGAEASPADGKGKRPVHIVAEFGHVAIAEHLAERGAKPSPADGALGAHVMPREAREFYALQRLWRDASVTHYDDDLEPAEELPEDETEFAFSRP